MNYTSDYNFGVSAWSCISLHIHAIATPTIVRPSYVRSLDDSALHCWWRHLAATCCCSRIGGWAAVAHPGRTKVHHQLVLVLPDHSPSQRN
jgi:hypothetical protein